MRFRSHRLFFSFSLLSALACSGKSVRNEDGGAAGDAGETGASGSSSGAGGTRPEGGTGATTMGGSIGAGGSAVGGAAGVSGTASGASGTAAGGSSGSSTGGSSGAGGSGAGGSGGSGTCPTCTPTACTTQKPPTRTLNDFENLLVTEDLPNSGIYGILDAAGMQKQEWWLGYFSGSYAFPTIPQACANEPAPPYPLSYTDVSGALHVTGTVGTYSGFGVWFGQCIIDMSSYRGISFTISGTPAGLDFKVLTSSNLEPQQCLTGLGTCSVRTAGACTPASVGIALRSTPTVVSVPWTALQGGSPAASVDASEIVQLRWDFEWADSMSPYAVNVTLDDVVLFE